MTTSLSYTVETLVGRIRRKAQLADDNLKLTTNEIIEIADEDIQTVLWPMLQRTRQDHLVSYYDQAVTAGTASYRLGAYVSSQTVVQVQCVLSTGVIFEVPLMDLARISEWAPNTGSTPAGYAFVGESITVFPVPSVAYTLRIYYERRPPRLVPENQCAIITSTTPTPGIYNCTNSGITGGMDVDAVASQPPFGEFAQNLNALLPTGTTIQLETQGGTLPSLGAFGAGDFVCKTGHTCVFPLPDAWWSVAVLQAAKTVLVEIGDVEGASAIVPDLERRLELLVGLQANRSRKQSKAYFQRNSPARISRRYGVFYGGNGNP